MPLIPRTCLPDVRDVSSIWELSCFLELLQSFQQVFTLAHWPQDSDKDRACLTAVDGSRTHSPHSCLWVRVEGSFFSLFIFSFPFLPACLPLSLSFSFLPSCLPAFLLLIFPLFVNSCHRMYILPCLELPGSEVMGLSTSLSCCGVPEAIVSYSHGILASILVGKTMNLLKSVNSV